MQKKLYSDKDAAKGLIDVRIKLSALWVSMMMLYIYADILSLFRPGQLEEIQKGMMGPIEVSQISLLAASAVVIIPAVMIFLSLVLKPKVNRWTNIILGTLFIFVNFGNLLGEQWVYYIVFGILELAIAALIVRYARTWPQSSTPTSAT